MKFRKKMSRGRSKKQFRKHAMHTPKVNFKPRPMRGGIRM